MIIKLEINNVKRAHRCNNNDITFLPPGTCNLAMLIRGLPADVQRTRSLRNRSYANPSLAPLCRSPPNNLASRKFAEHFFLVARNSGCC